MCARWPPVCASGEWQGESDPHPLRELPGDGAGLVCVRRARCSGRDHQHAQRRAPRSSYFAEHTECVGAITQPQFASLVADSAPGLAWIAVTEDNSGDPAPPGRGVQGLVHFASLLADPTRYPRDRPSPCCRPGSCSRRAPPLARRRSSIPTPMRYGRGRVGPADHRHGSDDTYLVFLPFFHVNAQSWSFWTTLGVGGTVVLQPKFSASRFWDIVTAHGVTHLSLIPFRVQGHRRPARSRARPQGRSLRSDRARARGHARVPGSSGLRHDRDGHPCHRCRALAALPGPVHGQADAADTSSSSWTRRSGALCPDGEVGELWVRGTPGIQLFLEYYDNPEAMAASFTEDGWFKTGDMVRIGEEGNFFYCERDKDVLKVGGENVSAREVEDLCRQVPGMADIAVVGRSHDMLDVVPVAFVVKGGPVVDDDELKRQIIEICKANLADFKVPRAVYLVDDFPRPRSTRSLRTSSGDG